jgi:hypothetical protein
MKKSSFVKAFATFSLYCVFLQASQEEFLFRLWMMLENDRGLIQTSPQALSDMIKERDPEHFTLLFQNILVARDYFIELDNLLATINTPQGYSLQNAIRAKNLLINFKKFMESTLPSKHLELGPNTDLYQTVIKLLEILQQDFPQLL